MLNMWHLHPISHEIGKLPRGTFYFKTCPVNKRLCCLVKLPYPCPSVVITQAQYFGVNMTRARETANDGHVINWRAHSLQRGNLCDQFINLSQAGQRANSTQQRGPLIGCKVATSNGRQDGAALGGLVPHQQASEALRPVLWL